MAERVYRRFEGDRPYTSLEISLLSDEEQVELMLDWFFANYQDPVERLPYNSREGGYLWVFGGPVSADEALQDEFSNFVELAVIQKAVAEIEAEGTLDWSPIPDDSDFEEILPPATGTVDVAPEIVDADDEWPPIIAIADPPLGDTQLQASLLEKLDLLEQLLVAQLPAPGIGHNNPPERIDDGPLSDAELSATIAATAAMKAEASSENPDNHLMERRVSYLKGAAIKISEWLGHRVTEGATAFMKALGAAAAAKLLLNWETIYQTMVEASTIAESWIANLF